MSQTWIRLERAGIEALDLCAMNSACQPLVLTLNDGLNYAAVLVGIMESGQVLIAAPRVEGLDQLVPDSCLLRTVEVSVRDPSNPEEPLIDIDDIAFGMDVILIAGGSELIECLSVKTPANDIEFNFTDDGALPQARSLIQAATDLSLGLADTMTYASASEGLPPQPDVPSDAESEASQVTGLAEQGPVGGEAEPNAPAPKAKAKAKRREMPSMPKGLSLQSLARDVQSVKDGQAEVLQFLRSLNGGPAQLGKAKAVTAPGQASSSKAKQVSPLPAHLQRELNQLPPEGLNLGLLRGVLRGPPPRLRDPGPLAAPQVPQARGFRATHIDLDGLGEGREAVWEEVVQTVLSEMSKVRPGTGCAATLTVLQKASEVEPEMKRLLETFGWGGAQFLRPPLWPQMLQALLRAQRALLGDSETLDGGKYDHGGGTGGEGDSATMAMIRALNQQSSVLQQLLAPKDPLSKLLGNEGDGAAPHGAKGAAARALLRQQFRSQPEAIYQRIEANMARELGREGQTLPPAPREYIEQRMPLGPYHATINYVSLIGAALEHLQKGEADHCRALLCLSLCAAEQLALDQGNWTLGWLFTLQPEPAYAVIGQHRPDPHALMPHCRIFEEAWVAGHLAYLRDADLVTERRKKYQRQPANEDREKEKPGKGKAKGDKKGGKGQETPP